MTAIIATVYLSVFACGIPGSMRTEWRDAQA
ncbi:hypothetical protein L21_2488 [Methanoculleus chikugoensis]|uniref:Uncharacterized protein n=1 Tax=Methanoculleus chikugoensis TaxID=118126 RepID=A0A1M4MNP8_9EURY|nr:hypothetical protein L21_2488 [Methanoculleus chikugoensis]